VLDDLELGGKPATLYVLAPEGWNGWGEIPKVEVDGKGGKGGKDGKVSR
jgi:hypothetical protein